jgi:hypothetical protein
VLRIEAELDCRRNVLPLIIPVKDMELLGLRLDLRDCLLVTSGEAPRPVPDVADTSLLELFTLIVPSVSPYVGVEIEAIFRST